MTTTRRTFRGRTAIPRIAFASVLCATLVLWLGCFKSLTTQASVKSSSDSSSSPFKSSSKSSKSSGEDESKGSDESEETAYQRDIRNYTVDFAQSANGLDFEAFQRQLGAIAESHGITDWERNADTYLAVGRGLGESQLDESTAEQLAIALSNESDDHLVLVRAGYDSRRNQ